MALEGDQADSAQETRQPIDCLATCPSLASVDAESLEALAAGAVQFSLPAGSTLLQAGSAPDGLYLLIAGRLGIRTVGVADWTAQIGSGELLGEMSWLLGETRGSQTVAIRDCELLWLAKPIVDAVAKSSSEFALALARLCARRLHRSNLRQVIAPRTRVFTIVPNGPETDAATLATQLVTQLSHSGRTQLVWDIRASSHTARWFSRIEECNDYVVYLADPSSSGWTRQCCRQADTLLLAANASGAAQPWPAAMTDVTARSGVRVELALLHAGALDRGSAGRWLATTAVHSHHHIVDDEDIGRVARLLSHRGVGLVLSGGGARGFAHLGVIQALREARVPIDFVGGASIGSIIAAGAALGWSDAEMRSRYRRSFVDTNPVNDYTFPFVALTRGRKVDRLLRREFGEISIEDLRLPYFCVSANLSTGRILEHHRGPVWRALRASVAIPGVMPPIFRDDQVLVDGAAINNLPIDVMKQRAPGVVIGSDVGADRPFTADYAAADQPPFWRLFSRTRAGPPRVNIFQILMRSGMVGGAAHSAAQRELADLILKPPLGDVDLLNWQSFDRAIEIGYRHTRESLARLPDLPRLMPPAGNAAPAVNSLIAAVERRDKAAHEPR